MPKAISVTFECEECGQRFEVPVLREIEQEYAYLAVDLDIEGDCPTCENCEILGNEDKTGQKENP